MMNLRLIAGETLALAGPTAGGEQSPYASLILMGLIFGIFYFVLIVPARNKQKKLEALVSTLKPGDRVIINPGIFGTIVAPQSFTVATDTSQRTMVTAR